MCATLPKVKTTSYNNPTVGSGSVVNDLAFLYDDLGQLVTEYQQHGCAVNTRTSLKVQYAYADGRELNYNYGSAGSADDALSRIPSD